MSDWMAEVKGRIPHRPKRRWWAVAARPMPQMPLDVVTAPGVVATAAYGLRQMRSSYVGPAINVRRSSDNATMDIGFRGAGDLDVQNLTTFIGGGSGFVAIWYDQSGGGGRNATQATAANQPQVILGGAPNGKTTVQSPNVTIVLTATIPAATTPLTLNMVAARTGALTSTVLPIAQPNNSPCLYFASAPNIGISNSNIDGFTGSGAADNAFHSATGLMAAAASSITIDGTTTTGSLSDHPGSTALYLFSLNLTSGFIGNMSEAIYWTGALDAPSIAAITANQRAYWGF